MHRYKAINLQALYSVVRGDDEYLKRYISRWYSTTFHTPLHETEELPFEYVLQHYHEYVYENLKHEDLQTAIKEILKDKTDIATAQDDDNLIRELEALNKKAEELSKTLKPLASQGKPKIDLKDLEHLEEISMKFDGEGNLKEGKE